MMYDRSSVTVGMRTDLHGATVALRASQRDLTPTKSKGRRSKSPPTRRSLACHPCCPSSDLPAEEGGRRQREEAPPLLLGQLRLGASTRITCQRRGYACTCRCYEVLT